MVFSQHFFPFRTTFFFSVIYSFQCSLQKFQTYWVDSSNQSIIIMFHRLFCILSLYNLYIELIEGKRDSQHLMWCFHKENTASRNSSLQGILPKFMLASLLILNSLGSCCTHGRYCRHCMSYFLLLYSTIAWWKLPTFMLALLGIFFRVLIFISKG